MSSITFKVSYGCLRKITLPREPLITYSSLIATLAQRFQLNQGTSDKLEVVYQDTDGDWITVSSDDELKELFASLPTSTSTVRLELRAKDPRTEGNAESTQVSSTSSAISSAGTTSDYKALEEEWTQLDNTGGKETELDEVQQDGERTPTLLFDASSLTSSGDKTFADPASPSLEDSVALAAERIASLVASEFPPRTSDAFSTPDFPVDAATPSASSAASLPDNVDDPEDEPLPSTTGRTGSESLPFTNLPTSLSTLLSGLPSHATSLSSHLSTLLTSPDSALSRLSSLALSPASLTNNLNPNDLSLNELTRAFSALSSDVGLAVREVVEGVRGEADLVRGEFERFRREVEVEKGRWESEVRNAEAKARGAEQSPSGEGLDIASPAASPGPATPPPASPSATSMSSSAISAAPSIALEDAARLRAAKLAKRAAREVRRREREVRRAEKAERRYTREAQMKALAGRISNSAMSVDSRKRSTADLARLWEQERKARQIQVPEVEKVTWTKMPGSLEDSAVGQVSEREQSEEEEMPALTGNKTTDQVPDVLHSVAAREASPHASFPFIHSPRSLPFYATSPASSIAGAPPLDPSRPVLLTTFLLVCRDTLGVNVNDQETRKKLTGIWTDSRGRGMEGLVERAVEELL
ncbi:hypothetical protein JCM11641_007328 [Rhodosporidiobolus odoratus]